MSVCLKDLVSAIVFHTKGWLRSDQAGTMKWVICLIVTLALTACASTNDSKEPEIDTDSIAGYWSGEVVGKPAAGKDVSPRDVQVIIIPGCTIGKVCGKFSEDNQCPGDIVLTMVAGNRYSFLSETASGARHICGSGDIRRFDLELRSDGTILFVYQNGATIMGILQKK